MKEAPPALMMVLKSTLTLVTVKLAENVFDVKSILRMLQIYHVMKHIGHLTYI
jgi:hypothetical protein